MGAAAVRPTPVSAHRLTGFGGAIHPGGQGDTIRQLIHRSRGAAEEEEESASWTTPSHWGGKLCVGRGGKFFIQGF